MAEDKNVLVIAYYFPPMGLSGVQRTVKFIKYLPEYGWKPSVLTSHVNPYYAFDEELENEIKEAGIDVYRTTPKKKPKNKTKKFPSTFAQKFGRAALQTLYQPDRMIKWKDRAVRRGERIFEKHDISVIFATAPPFTDFLVAKELSEKFDVPFVVDYRDVWIDNPFHYFATSFHRKYAQKLEAGILNTASKIIVTARNTKELLIKRYGFVSHDDILIIPHGYDPADLLPFAGVKPNKTKFTITHSGVFQDNRTPKYFLKALSNLVKKNPNAAKRIEARFIGIMRKNHKKYIKKYKLEGNVLLTGYLQHKDVIENLMSSDVLWLYLNDTVRSPGKLYEYIGARKPILICSPDGEMRRTALNTKAAIATEPKDVKSIEQALTTFFELWEKDNLPVPQPEYVEKFDRKILTGTLARELSLATEL